MTHTHSEPAAGPSGPGTVMLELGPGAGALILHTPPELNGAEIDITSDADGRRTHSQVRPRHVTGGTRYAAVYPDLPPGSYTLWHDHVRAALTVTVTGGAITSATWPGE
jgi:quercetin dioxygenase-like cupin family protein